MCLSQSKLQHDRRKPEETRLYQIISQHWQTFLHERAEEGRDVPKYIVDEFEAYLRCGILAYGFGRIYCPNCGEERIVAFPPPLRLWLARSTELSTKFSLPTRAKSPTPSTQSL